MWSEQLDRGPLTYLLRVMLGSLFLKKGNNLTIVWLQTKVSPLSLKVEERANESLLGWGGNRIRSRHRPPRAWVVPAALDQAASSH